MFIIPSQVKKNYALRPQNSMGIYFDFTNEDTEKTFKKHLPKAEIAHSSLHLFCKYILSFYSMQNIMLGVLESIYFSEKHFFFFPRA